MHTILCLIYLAITCFRPEGGREEDKIRFMLDIKQITDLHPLCAGFLCGHVITDSQISQLMQQFVLLTFKNYLV